jgi:outer membrane receptor protein involved in Fe transport
VSVQIPAFGVDDPGDNRHVEAESKSQAIYAQVTWTPPILDDRLDLTVGARYTEDDREATKDYVRMPNYQGPVSLSADFSKFNPAGTVSFRWTPDFMTYAKIATGYRAGGFSESSPDFSRGFDPEEVTSYELGLKSDAFDGRLRTNLALFLADYKDMQIDLSPDANDLSLTDTYNAGDASVDGVELDVTWAILQGLTLTGSYVHLHSDIDFIDASLSPILTDLYPDGNAAGAFRARLPARGQLLHRARLRARRTRCGQRGVRRARRWRAPRRTAGLHNIGSRRAERRSLQHAFAHAVERAPRLWVRFSERSPDCGALGQESLGQGLVLAQHRQRRRSRLLRARTGPWLAADLRTRAHVRVRTLTGRA